MKVRSLYVTGLLSLVIGIILILAYRNISSSGIITTGGILFILVGLLNLLVFKSRHRNDTSRSALASVVSTITSVGAIILGAFLLIFNSTFATVVPFVFAVFIALLALDQFFVLTVSGNRLYLSPWFLLAPLALTGCAIYLFIGDFSQQGEERLILCTGIATTFFGVVSVIEGLVVGQKSPRDTAPADNR
ncbi:MAG: DUF308 domain-containing protein [Muribaculaceae bacterium]|nr:DUF308 domain-containing protein [Muribaculaceae bacterium]